MSEDRTWVKPISISAIVAASILSLSDERLATVKTLYNNLVDYHIHGWALIALIGFFLYNQWLAIGATTRVERLDKAEKKLSETNQRLITKMNEWTTLIEAKVKLRNAQATKEDALTVMLWLAKDQAALQEVADKYKAEIKKG